MRRGDINGFSRKKNGLEFEKIIDAVILSLLLHQEYAKKKMQSYPTEARVHVKARRCLKMMQISQYEHIFPSPLLHPQKAKPTPQDLRTQGSGPELLPRAVTRL